MKKFLAIALAVLMLVSLVACGKKDTDTTGGNNDDTQPIVENVYDKFKYDVNENGELEITGFTYAEAKMIAIDIPAEIDGRPVVGIGKDAFKAYKNIAAVNLPNSITYIADYAFHDCDYISKITFPANLTTIGAGAFESCDNLETIAFQNGILAIGANAFKDCVSLKNPVFPETLLSIGMAAFWNCTSLTNVTIPTSIIELGDAAFYGCTALTDVTLMGDVAAENDEILAKMNAALKAYADENGAPKDFATAAAALKEAGLQLGYTSTKGAKFVWDKEAKKLVGAFTAADATLLTKVNEKLATMNAGSLDAIITALHADGIYLENLNACISSDKFVWDKETNEMTTIFAGEAVFNGCALNTMLTVKADTFFADYAVKNDYITIDEATIPEGKLIFSNGSLSFVYPETWIKTENREDKVLGLVAPDGKTVLAIYTQTRSDQYASWTNETFETIIKPSMDTNTMTVSNGKVEQLTNANGLAMTKVSYTVKKLAGSSAVESFETVYFVTVGNQTFRIVIAEATVDTALHTAFFDSLVALK